MMRRERGEGWGVAQQGASRCAKELSLATRRSRGSVCVAGTTVSQKRGCEPRRREQAGGHRAQVPRAQVLAAVAWCGGAGGGAWPVLARVGHRRASTRARTRHNARSSVSPVSAGLGGAGQLPVASDSRPCTRKRGSWSRNSDSELTEIPQARWS